MNPALTTGAAVLTLAALLALTHVPLGTWIHRVFTDEQDWRVERLVYRARRGRPPHRAALDRLRGLRRRPSRWSRSSACSCSSRCRAGCRGRSAGRWTGTPPSTPPSRSCRTRTGSRMPVRPAPATRCSPPGLTVQNFVSAAVGLAVAIALVRGLARHSTDRLGNFWVDLVRGIVRILLPMAVVAAVVLLVGGVIQNLADPTSITTVTGGTRSCRAGRSPRRRRSRSSAPTAAASSTPTPPTRSRTPTPGPTCSRSSCCSSSRSRCPYAYGRMVGSRRQGLVATATMAGLLVTSMGLAAGPSYSAAGGPLGSMEGKEQRFGIAWSSTLRRRHHGHLHRRGQLDARQLQRRSAGRCRCRT